MENLVLRCKKCTTGDCRSDDLINTITKIEHIQGESVLDKTFIMGKTVNGKGILYPKNIVFHSSNPTLNGVEFREYKGL